MMKGSGIVLILYKILYKSRNSYLIVVNPNFPDGTPISVQINIEFVKLLSYFNLLLYFYTVRLANYWNPFTLQYRPLNSSIGDGPPVQYVPVNQVVQL